VSTIDPVAKSEVVPENAPAGGSFWQRTEAVLESLAERLNPILVKEARQALKSKQFMITFSLLLLAGWGWSFLGISFLTPGIYYAPGGPFMLIGYFLILTIPMMVIAPFSAFRSLASECEDGTFELLSITALSSRQIVTGKLGSALLQMLVYYSALSPCIAFTYLLRGVDIATIFWILAFTLLNGIGLAAVGLTVATISRVRHWQTFLAVALLLALLFVTFLWCYTIGAVIGMSQLPAYETSSFWIMLFGWFTIYVAYTVMFVLAAAAQINFASDNRSTKLRVVMVCQQALIVGWLIYFGIESSAPGNIFLFVPLILLGLHWVVMGALMIGEMPQLSPRVLRSLPQTLVGRMLFGWFAPGSGTGYLFAATNLFAASLVVVAAGALAQAYSTATFPPDSKVAGAGLLIVSYVVGYLGIARLLILLMRKVTHAGLLHSFIVVVFLAIGSSLGPFFLQLVISDFTETGYTLLQIPNWAWSIYELTDNGFTPEISAGTLIVAPLCAALVFIINLATCTGEVSVDRIATPQRVVDDEIELHPEKAPKTPEPTDPWLRWEQEEAAAAKAAPESPDANG